MKSVEKCVEDGIEKLVAAFKSLPYRFYTEQDIHCFLYGELKSLDSRRGIGTRRGFRTTLVHKEYPTRGRYRKEIRGKKKGVLVASSSGARGRFDISVLDPRDIERIDSRNFRISKKPLSPACVVEVALNNYYATHLENDLLKMTDRRNGVETGHALIFFRDKRFPPRMNEDKYLGRVRRRSSRRANENISIRLVSLTTEKGGVPGVKDLTILGGKVVERKSS